MLPKVKSKRLKSKLNSKTNHISYPQTKPKPQTNKVEQHSLVELTPEEWKKHWL